MQTTEKRDRERSDSVLSVEQLGLTLGDYVELVYRDAPVAGTVVEEGVVVWGDVLVTRQELARGTDTYLGRPRRTTDKGAQRTGSADLADYHWKDGIVWFSWGDFTGPTNAANRAVISSAMQNWQNAVPGLMFLERVGLSEPDYVVFRNPGDGVTCQSAVGSVGGAQELKLDTSICMTVGTATHELGHAIGMLHEQQRSDRGANITITWANIAGCPNTATGPGNCGAGACAGIELQCGCNAGDATCLGAFGNFGQDTSSRRLNPYDWSSIMHYTATQWAKCLNAAQPVTACAAGQRTAITPVPNTAANRALLANAGTAISAGDALTAGLMYPLLRLNTVAFAPANSQRLCTLLPRTSDANTYMRSSGAPSITVNKQGLANLTTPGTYTVYCDARSVFWFYNYDYPNAVDLGVTDDHFFDGFRETWTAGNSSTLRVLNAGLIPVML